MRMMGVTAHGNGVSFRGGENFLKLVVIVAQFCEHTTNH